MAIRLTRAEQAEAVRAEVLAAARAEFLAAGYHGATLDRIAAAAGYTKGAVYSRFASKADLFLALLEERIDARTAQNEQLAASVRGTDGLVALAQRWSEIEREDLAWTLLVIEFRVHAARDPELNTRYAELHARTVEGVRRVLASVLGGHPTADQARLVLGMGLATTLERVAAPEALPNSQLTAVLSAIAGGTTRTTRTRKGR